MIHNYTPLTFLFVLNEKYTSLNDIYKYNKVIYRERIQVKFSREEYCMYLLTCIGPKHHVLHKTIYYDWSVTYRDAFTIYLSPYIAMLL